MPRGVCLQRREAAHRDVQAFCIILTSRVVICERMSTGIIAILTQLESARALKGYITQ
jgi:hypothetical protein